MSDKLKVGDTICCHGYSDMRDIQRELTEQGYMVTIGVGYTIRIETVPVTDPAEQDGYITWDYNER